MRKATTTESGSKAGKEGDSPAQLIDAKIKELNDWRGEMLVRLRMLIKQADPDVVEEWKWSVPVWSHAGIICTGETSGMRQMPNGEVCLPTGERGGRGW